MLILSDLSDILMHLVSSRAGTAKHNVLPIVLWHCKPGCSCAQQVKEQRNLELSGSSQKTQKNGQWTNNIRIMAYHDLDRKQRDSQRYQDLCKC